MYELCRLAQIFDIKYCRAANTIGVSDNKLNDIIRDLRDAYDNYINPKTVKQAYNILPLLAFSGESHAKEIVDKMQKLNESLFDSTPEVLFDQVNAILSLLRKLQKDNHTKIRNSIRNHWQDVNRRVPTENEMKMALSKWEQVVNKKLSNILNKQAEKLKRIANITAPIAGGAVSPIRREFTRQELFMFMHTPQAKDLGLDIPEVISQIIMYPDLKDRLTRVINSVENGKTGHDPVLAQQAADILKYLQLKQESNKDFFEAPESQAQEALKELKDPGEKWHQEMQKYKELASEERELGQNEAFNKIVNDLIRRYS